jgi:hypothetical protein
MSEEKHLEALQDIRSMMERSTRFLSLSGLSGVVAGIIALGGAYWGHVVLESIGPMGRGFYDRGLTDGDIVSKLISIALYTLGAALLSGFYFTYRKAKRNGHNLWDKTSKRLLVNLAIPLFVGGLFCLSLIYGNNFYIVPGATLIFYGLALINSAKYTLPEVNTLGIFQCVLGLIGCFLPVYSVLLWATGFGFLHIIYGSIMYFKYERKTA